MRRFLALAPLFALTACADRSQRADTTAFADTPAGQTTAAAGDVQPGLLDPNSATREQLAAVPGVDTAVVRIIVTGRPFADMVAVDRALAARLDSAQRRAVYARIFKPIDLNRAKGEEILLIPGVGRRMRREFEEYRPYRNIEQFRREIGKYVDDKEVARLERYVSIK